MADDTLDTPLFPDPIGVMIENDRRARLYDALWDLAYHRRLVGLHMAGTHVPDYAVKIGDDEFRASLDRVEQWITEAALAARGKSPGPAAPAGTVLRHIEAVLREDVEPALREALATRVETERGHLVTALGAAGRARNALVRVLLEPGGHADALTWAEHHALSGVWVADVRGGLHAEINDNDDHFAWSISVTPGGDFLRSGHAGSLREAQELVDVAVRHLDG